MTELLTSEVLDLSADHILGRGWQQNEGWNEAGKPVCLEGGIMAALGLTFNDVRESVEDADRERESRYYTEFRVCPAYKAVQEYLELGDTSLFWWNDGHGRTMDEVVEVLRAAAAVERVKEAALVPAAA